jgi:hypothetical protein
MFIYKDNQNKINTAIRKEISEELYKRLCYKKAWKASFENNKDGWFYSSQDGIAVEVDWHSVAEVLEMDWLWQIHHELHDQFGGKKAAQSADGFLAIVSVREVIDHPRDFFHPNHDKWCEAQKAGYNGLPATTYIGTVYLDSWESGVSMTNDD